MLLETYNKPFSFQLLDSGETYRLENWNGVILARPDPQAIWEKSLPASEWQKAWAVFVSGKGGEKGTWQIKKPLPERWFLEFEGVKFSLKLSPFKHTGIFAEQVAQWNWMTEKLKSENRKSKLKILNLFAYTGGASMVLAKAGCQVTHVDASKPALTWANENANLNNLPKESIRWILDDAIKFTAREVKRGAKYDGIILDPPAFGHSPTGKTWKFEKDLPGLLEECIKLLSPEAVFLLLNSYATNSSALALNNLLEDKTKTLPGRVEAGELCLKTKNNRLLSTGIFARWQKS